MEHLEEEVERRAPGTAGFIKKKLGDFIQCFDTLTDIFFINLRMGYGIAVEIAINNFR